jgi:hypothetical protein
MMYYNFVRIHSALRITPAIAAGMTDRLWEALGDRRAEGWQTRTLQETNFRLTHYRQDTPIEISAILRHHPRSARPVGWA